MNPVELKIAAEICAIYDTVAKKAEVDTNTRDTNRACRDAIARLHYLWSQYTLETEEEQMLVAAMALLGQAGWYRTGRRRRNVLAGLRNLRDLADATVARTLGGLDADASSLVHFIMKRRGVPSAEGATS